MYQKNTNIIYRNHYISCIILIVANTSGDAVPPCVTFIVIVFTVDEWFTNMNLQPNPLGETTVGSEISDGNTWTATICELSVPPFGQEKIPAVTGELFLKIANWHGCIWCNVTVI